jgi:hypothetical protein
LVEVGLGKSKVRFGIGEHKQFGNCQLMRPHSEGLLRRSSFQPITETGTQGEQVIHQSPEQLICPRLKVNILANDTQDLPFQILNQVRMLIS